MTIVIKKVQTPSRTVEIIFECTHLQTVVETDEDGDYATCLVCDSPVEDYDWKTYHEDKKDDQEQFDYERETER